MRNVRRSGVVLLVLGLLSACETSPPRAPVEPADGPPLYVPAGLDALPDPVVVEEPRSATGNPPAYSVAGKTYRVMSSASGYSASGEASWYGSKFHGRRTSSGEPFDMFALTAAHRALPIPAFARVTNLGNGRSTVVRINDRGPFHGHRLIDLSYAAAVKLGFADVGTARVHVQVLEPARDYYLQAGAFASLAAADGLKQRVETLIGQPAYVIKVSGDSLFRVRIGPVNGRAEAVRIQSVLAGADVAQPLILPL